MSSTFYTRIFPQCLGCSVNRMHLHFNPSYLFVMAHVQGINSCTHKSKSALPKLTSVTLVRPLSSFRVSHKGLENVMQGDWVSNLWNIHGPPTKNSDLKSGQNQNETWQTGLISSSQSLHIIHFRLAMAKPLVMSDSLQGMNC